MISGPDFNTKRIKLFPRSRSFTRSETPPNAGVTTLDISLAQDGSVIMWRDASDGLQYWYSDCDIIYMNPDSSNMFFRDANLVSLDLAFDASNVSNMDYMFSNCSALSTLNGISVWNTSHVTNMKNLFSQDVALRSLDLSTWDTSKVTNLQGMVNGCSALSKIIYGPNFIPSSLSSPYAENYDNGSVYAFNGCPANKPQWSGGYWTAKGTFIKNT